MKIFGVLTTLLVGCSPRKPPPDKPGTSVPLSYPILLLGAEAPEITVFDTELDFTTTSQSSSLTYTLQRIIDSQGRLLEVKTATPIGEVRGVWRDMGTSRYRVFLEMKFRKQVSLDGIRKMVLDNVRSPRSSWSRPPERLRSAVQSIESYRTLDDLIAGCRTQAGWLEDVPKWDGPRKSAKP